MLTPSCRSGQSGRTFADAETIRTAEVAISQIGTNALPYVLERMRSPSLISFPIPWDNNS